MKAKKSNKNFVIAGVVGLLLLVAAGTALFLLKDGWIGPGKLVPALTPDEDNGFKMDNNAAVGGWAVTDTEAIIAGLNEKVEEGMINISMNTGPVFPSGDSEGNLMIVNETTNRYPQIVEIIRNDTGETIYKSGGIPVGSKIESAKLDVALPAGTYECTAMFHNADPDTGESLGQAGAVITITILH